jgi:hypothetical protein
MARPSLLTPDRGAAIVDLARRGVPVTTAAEAVGISGATVREWLRRGEDRDDRPSAEVFATFATDLRQAEGLAIADAVSKITTAAHKQWRAAAWWLERTHPEHYGARRTIRTETAGANAPITLAGLAALVGMEDETEHALGL